MTSVDHWLSDPHPELDSWIYHYTTAESLIAIIESGNFRFGTFDNMNDPREAKQWFADQLVVPPGDEALHLEVDRILRRGARVGSFTADTTPTEGAAAGSLFHRGWGRAAVWDRYADSHRGACLVFDLADLHLRAHEGAPLRSGNVTGGGRVKYIDAPVSIPTAGTFSSATDLIEALDEMTTVRGVIGDLYLTKNRDWESEREFRIIKILWNLPDDELDRPMDVPFGTALKAIVLGDGFMGDEVELIAAIERNCPTDPPDLLRCSWWRGEPFLQAVDASVSVAG